MDKSAVIRTDTADSLIHKIILGIAEKFGVKVALEKLQGDKVLITEKNLVFYKIDEKEKVVTVYVVVDQREDYANIIRGL